MGYHTERSTVLCLTGRRPSAEIRYANNLSYGRLALICIFKLILPFAPSRRGLDIAPVHQTQEPINLVHLVHLHGQGHASAPFVNTRGRRKD